MKDFDSKVRQFLIEEGYLSPTTDEEIQRSLAECEANPPIIPPHLDDPMIYLQGVPVKVGLEAQGHIPTIEAMLKDWGYSHKYVWEAIGKKIGWCPLTACASYVNYLLRHG